MVHGSDIMNSKELNQTVTTLVTDRKDILESLATTGNATERALAETFLEIGVGQ
ncbi:hypothetical protein SAMN04488589_0625 [Methanolobus vulcani]|uniref:Uncharacterized protein n=1 Tax=Methanolobus vulcani TaxID=38026 RepID=A0A7Z7B0A9_9EURY|nr:hypothetical protein [Methanolobus vulcani]SDF47262.1 hypothetical protein SAMN04488589_0625 [Methanolobus vulcani]